MNTNNAFTERLIFTGDDSRLITQVGVRAGETIASAGQTGYLVFGPYIPLAAGQYQVVFHCTVGEGGLAGAYFDVAANAGNLVIVQSAFESPDENGCFVGTPISLDVPCTDLEVRVWVTDQTELQISRFEIVALETGQELVDAEPVGVAIQEDILRQDDNLITQSSEDTLAVDQKIVLADASQATGQNITLLTRKERKLIKARRKKKK